jgi:hypothetical protein
LDGRSAPWNQCGDLRHVITGSAVGEFDFNEVEMYPAFSEILPARASILAHHKRLPKKEGRRQWRAKSSVKLLVAGLPPRPLACQA